MCSPSPRRLLRWSRPRRMRRCFPFRFQSWPLLQTHPVQGVPDSVCLCSQGVPLTFESFQHQLPPWDSKPLSLAVASAAPQHQAASCPRRVLRLSSCHSGSGFDLAEMQPLNLHSVCHSQRLLAQTKTTVTVRLRVLLFFPTFGVGLFDFKLNSFPRPELFSSPDLLLETPCSAQFQRPWRPWSAQRPETPGVPNSRDCLKCTPRDSWSAQPQRLPGLAQPQLQAKTKKA